MAGPNDDQLKWPFKASIKVQMINWKCVGSHVQHTMVIDHEDSISERVRSDEVVAGGVGWPKFISHKELLNTTSEDTLYIEDDTVMLRVVDIQCWGKATTPTGMLSIILYIS